VVKTRKILWALSAVIWLTTGCSFNSGQVQLLNWGWFGTPDTVTVQRGDTLYSISKRYNVPLRDLIEANNLTPPYTLVIGRQLRLPTAKFHVVCKGDTLYNISKRYNVDVTTLSKLNNLQAPYTLSIGQRLAIPGSVGGSSDSYTPEPVKTTQKSSSFSFWKPAPKKTTSSSSTVKKTTTAKPASPSKYRKNKFAWPLKGTIVSKYGTIGKGRNNDGINIKAALGAADGSLMPETS